MPLTHVLVIFKTISFTTFIFHSFFFSSLHSPSIMLASSSAVMLASTTTNHQQQQSSSSSSRPSFPSLVRTLLLMVSPSSTSNTSTTNNNNDPNHSELDGELEDIKNNSLFLEAYFSFPALEEDTCETTSVKHCATDRIHQQHNSTPLLVGSNQVFC